MIMLEAKLREAKRVRHKYENRNANLFTNEASIFKPMNYYSEILIQEIMRYCLSFSS